MKRFAPALSQRINSIVPLECLLSAAALSNSHSMYENAGCKVPGEDNTVQAMTERFLSKQTHSLYDMMKVVSSAVSFAWNSFATGYTSV